VEFSGDFQPPCTLNGGAVGARIILHSDGQAPGWAWPPEWGWICTLPRFYFLANPCFDTDSLHLRVKDDRRKIFWPLSRWSRCCNLSMFLGLDFPLQLNCNL